jgi:hypothetical protein
MQHCEQWVAKKAGVHAQRQAMAVAMARAVRGWFDPFLDLVARIAGSGRIAYRPDPRLVGAERLPIVINNNVFQM